MREESKNKKPKWSKPKLIVLVRGDRQERVLLACKVTDVGGAPGAFDAPCAGALNCTSCFTPGLS